jgi:23S rRNA (uracil1939-C5)-methyltransferase
MPRLHPRWGGIIRHEGKPVFVDGLFLNEEAVVTITFTKPDFSVGRIKQLITLSPDRIKPRCPVATACGGCSFQALSYKAQLEFKKRKVSEALRKIGKIEVPVDDVIGMDNPYFYRNKTRCRLDMISKTGLFRVSTDVTAMRLSRLKSAISKMNEAALSSNPSKN